jgi:hypothetical protein
MKLEPIDGFKIINSFENCIRIITYIQPNLYSRLLYFKHTIDKCLVKLEQRDFLQLNSVLSIITSGLNNALINQIKFDKKKNNSNNSDFKANLKNSLILLNASNIELCTNLKCEISKTVTICNKTSEKLNAYIKSIRNQNLFKDASTLLKKHKGKSENLANLKESETNSNDDNNKEIKPDSQNTICCQDYIQHRIFLNKSLLNTIESFINEIKLNKIVANLSEKIKMDKEILLIFSHIKREEKYINSYEPLQPLFRRYSLGYERVIQIWRKKCCGDNLVILNTDFHRMFSTDPANLNSTLPIKLPYDEFRKEEKQISTNILTLMQNQVSSISINDGKNELEKSFSGKLLHLTI